MLEVRRRSVGQQVGFGVLVGFIFATVVWIAFYVVVLHPQRVPVVEGEYLHSVVLAPSDLTDREDVVSFDVDIEPCCWQPELKLFSSSGEQWRVVLVYRSTTGEVKAATWQFVSGYGARTGDSIPLSGIVDVSLVGEYSDSMLAAPLAFKNLVVPKLVPISPRARGVA